MKKFLLALLTTLLLVSTSFADVYIPKEHRIQNKPPGYCCWCCVEMLGRNQGIEELKNLTKNRESDPDYIEWVTPSYGIVIKNNFGTPNAVRQKLDSLGVGYKFCNNDTNFLREVTKTTGCVVFMREEAFGNQAHAIILTEYNDEYVAYLDPNGCGYWNVSRTWFDYYWAGYAFTIHKKTKLETVLTIPSPYDTPFRKAATTLHSTDIHYANYNCLGYTFPLNVSLWPVLTSFASLGTWFLARYKILRRFLKNKPRATLGMGCVGWALGFLAFFMVIQLSVILLVEPS